MKRNKIPRNQETESIAGNYGRGEGSKLVSKIVGEYISPNTWDRERKSWGIETRYKKLRKNIELYKIKIMNLLKKEKIEDEEFNEFYDWDKEQSEGLKEFIAMVNREYIVEESDVIWVSNVVAVALLKMEGNKQTSKQLLLDCKKRKLEGWEEDVDILEKIISLEIKYGKSFIQINKTKSVEMCPEDISEFYKETLKIDLKHKGVNKK